MGGRRHRHAAPEAVHHRAERPAAPSPVEVPAGPTVAAAPPRSATPTLDAAARSARPQPAAPQPAPSQPSAIEQLGSAYGAANNVFAAATSSRLNGRSVHLPTPGGSVDHLGRIGNAMAVVGLGFNAASTASAAARGDVDATTDGIFETALSAADLAIPAFGAAHGLYDTRAMMTGQPSLGATVSASLDRPGVDRAAMESFQASAARWSAPTLVPPERPLVAAPQAPVIDVSGLYSGSQRERRAAERGVAYLTQGGGPGRVEVDESAMPSYLRRPAPGAAPSAAPAASPQPARAPVAAPAPASPEPWWSAPLVLPQPGDGVRRAP